MNIKYSAMLFLLAGHAVVINGANRLFLKNDYKDPILYTVVNGEGTREVMLNPAERHFVGFISLDKDKPTWRIQGLSIRGAGAMGALGFNKSVSLDEALKGIMATQKNNCNTKQPECLSDAVITVDSSSADRWLGWNVSVNWLAPTQPNQQTAQQQQPPKPVDPKILVMKLKEYVTQLAYDKTVKMIDLYRADFQKIFSGGQLTAITVGASAGADSHQKQAALKFLNQALNKLGVK